MIREGVTLALRVFRPPDPFGLSFLQVCPRIGTGIAVPDCGIVHSRKKVQNMQALFDTKDLNQAVDGFWGQFFLLKGIF